MTYVPRTTFYGCNTSWAGTAGRPPNPNHGQTGYNETSGQIEVYDAIAAAWLTFSPSSASPASAPVLAPTGSYSAGGTAASVAQTIVAQNAFVAAGATAAKYYATPAPQLGLEISVINQASVSQILVGNSGEKFFTPAGTATSFALGASGGTASTGPLGIAPDFISDGTNWYRQAV